MLTDIQIKDLSNRMSIPYGGCYFKDELPKLKPNLAYFVNLQDGEDDDGHQNEGTHWTLLYTRETPNKTVQPIFFDPYGQPPSEAIKKAIKLTYNLGLPYTTKDIQSLMNNACGFYCLALAHFITSSKYRVNDLYQDIDTFMDMFDDLNHSIDWKKNEYILKHFFVSEGNKKEIDNTSQTHSYYEKILSEDTGGGIDLMKIPVGVKVMDKKTA